MLAVPRSDTCRVYATTLLVVLAFMIFNVKKCWYSAWRAFHHARERATRAEACDGGAAACRPSSGRLAAATGGPPSARAPGGDRPAARGPGPQRILPAEAAAAEPCPPTATVGRAAARPVPTDGRRTATGDRRPQDGQWQPRGRAALRVAGDPLRPPPRLRNVVRRTERISIIRGPLAGLLAAVLAATVRPQRFVGGDDGNRSVAQRAVRVGPAVLLSACGPIARTCRPSENLPCSPGRFCRVPLRACRQGNLPPGAQPLTVSGIYSDETGTADSDKLLHRKYATYTLLKDGQSVPDAAKSSSQPPWQVERLEMFTTAQSRNFGLQQEYRAGPPLT